jgi:hypothetical protein
MESQLGCGTVAEGARTQAVIPPAPTERQYALRRHPLAVAAIAAGAAAPQDCTAPTRCQASSLDLIRRQVLAGPKLGIFRPARCDCAI